MLTIRVGKDEPKRSFKIHEHVINDHTDYFHNHLKFTRAQNDDDSVHPESRVIDLSDHDPEAFALWRTWIYTGKLAILPELPFPPDSMDERSAHYTVLAHAYILGGYLLDIAFMNAITDVYVLNARGIDGSRALYPSNEEIGVLYDGTSPDSPIRKLLVDIWMYRGKAEWLDKEMEEGNLPREFLVEVMRELLKLKKTGTQGETMSRPWKLTHEQYHDQREILHGSARDHRVEDGVEHPYEHPCTNSDVCATCLLGGQ